MEAGQDDARFWKLTLRVIHEILEGAAARFRHQHNENAWLAWHIAALPRVKHMPTLKSMLWTDARPRAAPDENNAKREFAAWSAWVDSRK